MDIEHIELRGDSAAAWYLKQETVQVRFTSSPGVIASREGANHYASGDALITGSTGDQWSVSRARFDDRYDPLPPLVHGDNGSYRARARAVLAKQILVAFSVRRSPGGDLLHGNAGDWLLQYAPGDWGVVEQSRFLRVYRPTTAPWTDTI